MPTAGWKIAFCLDGWPTGGRLGGAVRQSRTMHILSSQKGAAQVSIDQHDDRLDLAKSQKLSSRPWANWANHEQGYRTPHPSTTQHQQAHYNRAL